MQVGGSPEVGVRHEGRWLAAAGGALAAWRPAARRGRRAVCAAACLLSLKDVKVEDDKTQEPFCIYSCPLRGMNLSGIT